MKKTFFPLLFLLVLSACSSAIEPTPAPPTATIVPTETETPIPTETSTSTPVPTETPEPTNTPEPTATNTPIPTNTPEPTVPPTAEPIPPALISGEGDQVVELEKPESGAVALHITGNGSGGNFSIVRFDADGERIGLLVNTVGGYSGKHLIDLQGEETKFLEIKSSNTWEVEVITIGSIEGQRVVFPGTAKGAGDDYFFIYNDDGKFARDNDAMILRMINASDKGNFAVWAWGDRRSLLANEVGLYDGEVILPSGTFLIIVSSSGEWGMEAREN